jgi:hypothetical protein
VIKKKKCKVCLFLELGEQLLYENLTRSKRHYIQSQRESLRLQFLKRSIATLTHDCVYNEVHKAIITDYRKSEKVRIERELFQAETYLELALNNYGTLLTEREAHSAISYRAKLRHAKNLISQRRRRVRELKENLGIKPAKSAT